MQKIVVYKKIRGQKMLIQKNVCPRDLLPGQMLHGQISPGQLSAVIDGLTSLHITFGEDLISKS